ncbi:MAG: sigma-70 family RNA polymerase sigma factor [Kiritimatiellae bacterium]|nr:sigma-70 family RNA polymerase sigma factor [Kiritimatiellia bacterium]
MNRKIESILRRVLAGELDAYGELVELCQQDVWVVVASYVRNRAIAEDIVQKAFIKAYFALEQYEFGRDFVAWLKTIAKNETKMALRARLTREKTALGFAEQLDLERAAWRADTGATDRLREHLRECLAQLPDPIRELVDARYALQRSMAELAEAMQRSAVAVRKALSRARALLRACIEAKAARNAG